MAFPTGAGQVSGVKSDKGGTNYVYSTGVQPNGTPSIGNWNTGGSPVGIGDSKNVYNSAGVRIGGSAPALGTIVPKSELANYSSQFNPGGYAGGVTTGPIAPVNPQISPVVAALARRLSGYQANPFQRYQTPGATVLPRQYGPRAWDNQGQYGANNPAMGFSLANFNNGTWGGAQQTNIAKSPGGGGYTNINKNGGAGGMQFSYGGPR